MEQWDRYLSNKIIQYTDIMPPKDKFNLSEKYFIITLGRLEKRGKEYQGIVEGYANIYNQLREESNNET